MTPNVVGYSFILPWNAIIVVRIVPFFSSYDLVDSIAYHMIQGGWLYVCGVSAAAVCYIQRGYELLKNGSIFTNLKALNNYQTPMCVDLLGEH